MQYDRMPRTAVDVDVDANAEEMTVFLSFREVALTHPEIDLSQCVDVEPWLRVREGANTYVSFGVTAICDEEDGA